MEAPRDAVSGARYGDFIWASEKTGYVHLYYHDGVDGECAHAITGGEWCVDELIGVDEGRGVRVLHRVEARAAGEAPVPRAFVSDPGRFVRFRFYHHV